MKKNISIADTFQGAFFIAGILAPLFYITGIWILSLTSGKCFNEVILYSFDPVKYKLPLLAAILIKPAVIISAFLLILTFPGALFALVFLKKSPTLGLTKFLSLSFVFNIALLFFGTTFLKIFGIAIDRKWLVILIIAATLVAFILAIKKKIAFTKYDFRAHKDSFLMLFILIFIIMGFIISFQDSVLRPLPVNFDYSEEAVIKAGAMNIGARQTEMGVAHYLKTKIFPYWLIEYLGRFGIYLWTPPLPYYLDFFNVTLLGESYASFSLMFLLFACCIFLFVYKIIRIGGLKENKKSILFYLAPALFMLSFLWLYMLPNRRIDLPVFVCPANSIFNTLQGLWIFLIMGLIFFIIQKELWLAVVFSIIASLSRYETIPIVLVLTLLAYHFNRDPVFIKSFLKRYCAFSVIFIAGIIALALSHEHGIKYLQGLIFDKIFIRSDWLRDKFSLPTVHQQIWWHFNIYITMVFIKSVMLTTYFYFPVSFLPSRDKISKFCSLFAVIYFLAIVIQSHKLLSYAGLLIPLAGINIRRFIYPGRKQQWASLLAYFVILFLGAYYFLVVLKDYNLI